MKNFLINFLIYYVCISLAVGLVTLLTGIHGVPLLRLGIASLLAYVQPIYKK